MNAFFIPPLNLPLLAGCCLTANRQEKEEDAEAMQEVVNEVSLKLSVASRELEQHKAKLADAQKLLSQQDEQGRQRLGASETAHAETKVKLAQAMVEGEQLRQQVVSLQARAADLEKKGQEEEQRLEEAQDTVATLQREVEERKAQATEGAAYVKTLLANIQELEDTLEEEQEESRQAITKVVWLWFLFLFFFFFFFSVLLGL